MRHLQERNDAFETASRLPNKIEGEGIKNRRNGHGSEIVINCWIELANVASEIVIKQNLGY